MLNFKSFSYLRTYLYQSTKLRKKYPDQFNLLNLVSTFPVWLRTLQCEWEVINEKIPWITFSAIDFLKKNITTEMRVFEYGSGGSTLFFASRTQEGVSVEHDLKWYKKISNILEKNSFQNWQIYLVEPEIRSDKPNPTDLNNYASSDGQYEGQFFQKYVTFIDRFPDEYLDLILIDGRSRPSCFKHAVPKIKPGGYIVWDNTDRLHYQMAMSMAPADFIFRDFPGPSPCVTFFTRTSIWQRLS